MMKLDLYMFSGAEAGGAEASPETSAPTQPLSPSPAEAAAEAPSPAPEARAGDGANGEKEAARAALTSLESTLGQMEIAARVSGVRARWQAQEAQLREIYPAFSLEKSLKEDADFRRLLGAGVSMARAYEAVHLPEIVENAAKAAALGAAKAVGANVLASSSRARENAVLDRAAAVMKKDVGALSEREILGILEQVKRGETVRF